MSRVGLESSNCFVYLQRFYSDQSSIQNICVHVNITHDMIGPLDRLFAKYLLADGTETIYST